jgi:hypothetical protein
VGLNRQSYTSKNLVKRARKIVAGEELGRAVHEKGAVSLLFEPYCGGSGGHLADSLLPERSALSVIFLGSENQIQPWLMKKGALIEQRTP